MILRTLMFAFALVAAMMFAAFVSTLYHESEVVRLVARNQELADSLDVLNARLADAEAQATLRLEGWRSESRSTPMPDSTWETRFVADPVCGTLALGKDRRNIARAILVDERGRVIVYPGADSLRARRGAR